MKIEDRISQIKGKREVKTKVKTVSKLTQDLQKVFNEFIRLRDKGKPCISCGAPGNEAGHYFSAGHYTALRFNEMNVNLQCTRCNRYLSGNLIEYRKGLVKKYGKDKVELLENSAEVHKTKKWSRFELESLITFYKQKIKELK